MALRRSTGLYLLAPLLAVLFALALTAVSLYLPGRMSTHDRLALSPAPADTTRLAREIRTLRERLARAAPRDPYIVINTHTNVISLRTTDKVLLEATCSTGSGDTLVDTVTGRRWVFDTPRGRYRVDSKLPQPWWRKPDWSYIEEGVPIPGDPRQRLDPNMMGDYALGFGDGYYIHGTIYERLLGINVTHGCVRVGADDLARLYRKTPLGTAVYVF